MNSKEQHESHPLGCSTEDVARLVDYKLNELLAGSKPFPAVEYPWMPGFDPIKALTSRPHAQIDPAFASRAGAGGLASLAPVSALGPFPLAWPLLRLLFFLVELEIFPKKIDRTITYLSIGQPGGVVLPPNPNRFPNLRRMKRLVEEARQAFDQGNFAQAKAKLSEARTVAMLDATRQEIAEVAVDNPTDPNSTNPTGRILADITMEVKFMVDFITDLVPE